MLKELHNECRIHLEIQPIGPILIKSGEATGVGADMTFVRTYRDGQQQVFLPGTSLKGVIRAHAERIGRTLEPHKICNPFNNFFNKRNNSPHGEPSCSDYLVKLEEQAKREVKAHRRQGVRQPSDAYRDACPACRLFGSLGFGGRFNIADAYSAAGGEPTIEYRDGVGIDRFSGGASNGAKFQFEVITGGRFQTVLTVRNFEIWQLSWLFHVLQDMEDGLVSMGLGSSRGLGAFTVRITHLELDVLAATATGSIPSLAEAVGSRGNAFGLKKEAPLVLEQKPIQRGLRQRFVLDEAARAAMRTRLAPRFAEALRDFLPLTDRKKARHV